MFAVQVSRSRKAYVTTMSSLPTFGTAVEKFLGAANRVDYGAKARVRLIELDTEDGMKRVVHTVEATGLTLSKLFTVKPGADVAEAFQGTWMVTPEVPEGDYFRTVPNRTEKRAQARYARKMMKRYQANA